jgi:type II secretory pathway predicted ATPase ExeA
MTTVDKLLHHFGLTALPFDRAVPPEGLLAHASFAEALERLRFAVDARGPGVLVAPPDTGKSVLLQTLCASWPPSDVRVIATALSSCGPFGLVGQLAARYGTPVRRTTAQAAWLAELSGSAKMELLDEAHRLPNASLESSASSANSTSIAESPSYCSWPANPPSAERLQHPDFDALWQRLVVRTSLAPLIDRESAEYLDRRPRAVGARAMLFPVPSTCSSSTVAASCAGSTPWPPARSSPPRAGAARMSTPPTCRPPSSTMSTPDRVAPYRTLPAARVATATAPVRWLLDGLFLAGGAGILGGAPKPARASTIQRVTRTT